MLSQYFALNLEQQLSKITKHGFCVMDNFIPPSNVLALVNEITQLNDAALMLEAGTGRSVVSFNHKLRGDSIYWLNEDNASIAQQDYFKKMEILRLGLNQHLYLGLFALESHLALYPTGAGYKKHVDRFKSGSPTTGQTMRQISCILYLNQDWVEADGGQLRLYLNADNTVPTEELADSSQLKPLQLDIAPISGRLVLFLSDTFYHEVLATTKDRMSLTGWFLAR